MNSINNVYVHSDLVDNSSAGRALHYYQKASNTQFNYIEKELLSLNGISIETANRRVQKRFKVYVCQLHALDIYQLGAGEAQPTIYIPLKKKKWKRINKNSNRREIKKTINLAIRSLYVLGIDVGIVEMGVFPSEPKYRVIGFLALGDQEKSKREKSIQRLINDKKSNESAKLGADLEFVLRRPNGKFVVASTFLSRRGKVGHDAITLKGKNQKYPLAEIRPAPSTHPIKLFKNVESCLRLANKKITSSNLQWLAGGRPLKRYPIGGHIHFSNVTLNAQLVRALDNYLTLPILLLESEHSLQRRPKYGFIGDYRKQFHGGFEYRTPPSWIVSPTIAKGVICLAKLIAEHANQLTWLPLNQFEIQKAFYEGRQGEIKGVVSSLWSNLQKLKKYQDYRDELNEFYSLIEKGYRWDEFADIRKAWNL